MVFKTSFESTIPIQLRFYYCQGYDVIIHMTSLKRYKGTKFLLISTIGPLRVKRNIVSIGKRLKPFRGSYRGTSHKLEMPKRLTIKLDGIGISS